MKQRRTTLETIGALILTIAFITAPLAMAQTPCGGMKDEHGGHEGMEAKHHDMEKAMPGKVMGASPHRGSMHETDEFRFETVFTETEIRVYAMNAAGKAISPKDIEGSVTIQTPEGKPETLPLKWTSGTDDPVAANRIRPSATADDALGYLAAAGDFKSVEDEAFDAHIMLSKVPGEKEQTAHWMTPYERTPLFGMACPMHPDEASLEKGTCSQCGGMEYQMADIFYECCPGCGDMRMTSPGICYKCGMELQPKAVDYEERKDRVKISPEEPRHTGHSH